MFFLRILLTTGAVLVGGLTPVLVARSFDEIIAPVESSESGSAFRIFPVETIRQVWQDGARGRPLPVKIYLPLAAEGRFPVIVFSHGLGRSCEDYAYLGNAWASRGFLTIIMQHPGSDESVWRGTLRPKKHLKEAYDNKNNLYQRSLDLRFALDRLTELQQQGDGWAGQADLSSIGAAGNDWGAEAALALAGEVLPDGWMVEDPRIRAVLALSPTVESGLLPLEAVYAAIHVPCFFIAGTEDNGRIGETKAAERRLPFDFSEGADQYLMILYGGDHMVYAGHRWGRREIARDAHYQRLIRIGSLLFWEAYLKHDPRAMDQLARGGLKRIVGGQAWLERKPALVPPASGIQAGSSSLDTSPYSW
ncbi:MAG: hypothetical protein JXB10_02670 [Pirellulales bacterium]|nr:hypothetical protein [Pirellulales bacterium]